MAAAAADAVSDDEQWKYRNYDDKDKYALDKFNRNMFWDVVDNPNYPTRKYYRRKSRGRDFPVDAKYDFFVDKSKIEGAGEGLFAAREYREGTILGVYRGAVFVQRRYVKDTAEEEAHFLDRVIDDPSVSFMLSNRKPIPFDNKDYVFEVHGPNGQSLLVDGQTSLFGKINDKTECEHDINVQMKSGEQGGQLVLTEKVYGNQELYMSYGDDYWKDKLKKKRKKRKDIYLQRNVKTKSNFASLRF